MHKEGKFRRRDTPGENNGVWVMHARMHSHMPCGCAFSSKGDRGNEGQRDRGKAATAASRPRSSNPAELGRVQE